MDIIDIFDIYQEGRIAGLEALRANTNQRLTGTSDRVQDLEIRYERRRIRKSAVVCMWCGAKQETGDPFQAT